MGAFENGLSRATSRLSAAWTASAFATATAFSVVVAILERADASGRTAADYTLSDALLAWVLPLLAYAAVGRVGERGRADAAVQDMARHGSNRRTAFLGLVVATGLRVASIAGIVALIAVVAARGRLDIPSISDALTSAWIVALGGASYVALFALGSLFGGSGQGRAVALGADFIFGALPSAMAAAFPRSHLSSLIGGHAVLGLAGWQSTACLYAIAAVCVMLGAFRVAP